MVPPWENFLRILKARPTKSSIHHSLLYNYCLKGAEGAGKGFINNQHHFKSSYISLRQSKGERNRQIDNDLREIWGSMEQSQCQAIEACERLDTHATKVWEEVGWGRGEASARDTHLRLCFPAWNTRCSQSGPPTIRFCAPSWNFWLLTF